MNCAVEDMMASSTNLLVLVIILAYSSPGLHSYDYCNMEEGCNHIACDSNEKAFKTKSKMPSTNNFTTVVMSRRMRRAILDTHNEKRNEIACGKIVDSSGAPYPIAARMRELVWDNELEYVARKHAEKCVFAHDECRKTSVFKNAGQNLAQKTSSGNLPSPVSEVVYFSNAWFNEFKDASISEVDSVGSTQTDAHIGHFTVMVNERVTKIGCALTRCFLGPKKTMHLFTCNYSYTNMKNLRMYKTSDQAASECLEVDAEKSEKYSCLCEESDFEIDD